MRVGPRMCLRQGLFQAADLVDQIVPLFRDGRQLLPQVLRLGFPVSRLRYQDVVARSNDPEVFQLA